MYKRQTIAFEGDALPGDRRRNLVPIDRLRSVEEEVVEDGSRNLEQYLRLEGYRAATAPATRQRANGVLRITFDVDRGPLHVLGFSHLAPTYVDALPEMINPRTFCSPFLDDSSSATVFWSRTSRRAISA